MPTKEYYQKNKEKIKAQSAQHFLENKEKIKKRQAQYYLENAEKIKKRLSNYYHANKKSRAEQVNKWRKANPAKHLLGLAKYRAKRDDLPFDIAWEDINIPSICPILEIPLEKGVGKVSYTSPTLDKIIPEQGYVKGNIQVISHKANVMKNNATPEELVLFAKWVQRTYPEMF